MLAVRAPNYLQPAEVVMRVDFGNKPKPGEVHGTKWRDDNGNGARDPGEPGVAGVIIYVDLNRSGTLDFGDLKTVTMADDLTTPADETGMELFMGLLDGGEEARETSGMPLGKIGAVAGAGAVVLWLLLGGGGGGEDQGSIEGVIELQ